MPERSSRRRKSASVYSRDDHEVGRRAPPAAPCRPWGSGRPTRARGPRCSTCPASSAAARDAHQPLRGQDLDQHLVRGQVHRGHALRCGGRGRRGREPRRPGRGRRRRRIGAAPIMRASAAGGPRTRSRRARRPRPPRTGTGCAEHRAVPGEVWNSPFSPQGSTAGGQVARGARGRTRGPRRRRAGARVDAGERGAQPARDHLLGERARGPAPEREERGEAGAGHPLLAVAPDVLEEQVAEGDGLDAPRLRARPGRRAMAAS